MTSEEEDFIFAVEDYDISTIKHFINTGIYKNIIFTENQEMALMPLSVSMLNEDNEDFFIGLKIIILFLKNDIDINMKSNTGNTALTATQKNSFLLVKLLLIAGANPNIINGDEKQTALSYIINDRKEIFTSKLLLKYGAYVNINKKYNSFCHCTLLEKSIIDGIDIAVYSLLSNGADTRYPNEFGDSMLQILEENKEKYTHRDYKKIEILLNPNNPPYLKLGGNEEDKYIIYENEMIDKKGYLPYATPYLLADKTSYKNKKYLYEDNKIDTFVYWAYTKELLKETVMKKIEGYIERKDIKDITVLTNLITKTIGHELTTDHFTDKGKKFASSYLTVTHWWYNLHTDFNRLYQEENNKLPRAIQSQEELDTILKLLDIRYKQFQSGKDFNSNQNKEELEALIEGREAPKRVVDLSFLD